MMGMKLIFVAALSAYCAVFLAHSAPTSLASGNDANSAASPAVAAEKPLVRTKRAEEILYGNHQNAPRVKKSDPAVVTSEDDVSSKNDDVTKDDAKTSSTVLDEKEKTVDSEQSAPSGEQDEIPPQNEPLHNVEDIPAEPNDADYQRYEDQEASDDVEALRKKRSIKTAMMTAENMAGGSSSSRSSLVSRPVRAKRDLDYEDLRQLFGESRESPYEPEELEDSEGPDRGRVYMMAPEQGAEEEEDDGEGEDEEEGLGVEPSVPLSVALRSYEYQPSYERPSEKEELLRELVERKVEEDAREKLLDYLLAAAIASEAESAVDEEAETDANGGDDDEGIIEEGPGREDYEDGIGAEQPVALKRNDFYPYSYEPYGGRWGAMVPGTKRSADEYERLYRLAEALNADDDDYEQ